MSVDPPSGAPHDPTSQEKVPPLLRERPRVEGWSLEGAMVGGILLVVLAAGAGILVAEGQVSQHVFAAIAGYAVAIGAFVLAGSRSSAIERWAALAVVIGGIAYGTAQIQVSDPAGNDDDIGALRQTKD